MTIHKTYNDLRSTVQVTKRIQIYEKRINKHIKKYNEAAITLNKENEKIAFYFSQIEKLKEMLKSMGEDEE